MDKAQKSTLRSERSTDSGSINPTRITLARKRKGLSKTTFAREIDVDRKSVQAYEDGRSVPSEGTMAKILGVLGFPRNFFFGDDLEVPSLETGSFRAMSKMKAPKREMALSQAALGLHLNSWICQRFRLPEPDIPNLGRQPDPEAAAEFVRRQWSLGNLSIRNMVHLLESKGVRVFSLAVDAREVDAFSLWSGNVPFIFLNANKTSEHSRFDAAHELGHLVLHKHGPPNGIEAEKQANAFASAFLMPRGSVIANAPRFPTYDVLVDRKQIWIVSVAALAYRMHQLGLMTDWQYRGACIQIAKRGKDFEPNEAPRETSIILPKVFSALYEDGLGRAHVARDLCIPIGELEQLLFGLTLAAVDGKRSDHAQKGAQHRRLALVEKA